MHKATSNRRAEGHAAESAGGKRRVSLAELMSCTNDGKRVVAEACDTGELVHVEDAASGLACRCVSPGCGRPMVAHKGKKRRHFQHAADGGDCHSSSETALHKFAKEVLEKALRLRLPGLEASDGRHSLSVVAERDFLFDGAVLEQRVGEIVPDVICRKADRVLHVEFMVTHACGQEKIERLREMDVGAIEIDLSGYRNRPLDALAEAILLNAPRAWLHNPKAAEAHVRLAQMEVERVASLDRHARAMIDGLPDIGSVRPRRWEAEAAGHGLGSFLRGHGLAIGFLVPEAEWKAFLLVTFGMAQALFSAKDAYDAIKKRRWVADGFIYIDEETAVGLRRVSGRNLLPPWEAVSDFLDRLEKSRVLVRMPFDGRFHGGPKLHSAIKAAKEEAERPVRRTDELRGLVDAILAPVRRRFKDGFDFDRWLASNIGGSVPQVVIASDGEAFDHLVKRLERLRRGMSSYPPYVPETLGLPVTEEVEARTEARLADDERRTAETAERLRHEADAREENLTASAGKELGIDGTALWMDAPHEALDNLPPREMARRSQSDYWRACNLLGALRDQRRQEFERANRRLQRWKSCAGKRGSSCSGRTSPTFGCGALERFRF